MTDVKFGSAGLEAEAARSDEVPEAGEIAVGETSAGEKAPLLVQAELAGVAATEKSVDGAPPETSEPAANAKTTTDSAAPQTHPSAGLDTRPRGAAHEVRDPNAGANRDAGANEREARDAPWTSELNASVSDLAVDEEAMGEPIAAASRPGRGSGDEALASPNVNLSVKTSGPAAVHADPVAPAAPDDATPPELRFAAANHDNIVKSMRADVLPNGGSMRIRLDPPQLGALQVTVQIRDGMITAAFETSNDEATKLLGHSLNQLKAVLESHGVGVEKLQVQQAPRDERPGGAAPDDHNSSRDQHPQDRDHAARHEQQRRDMLRRMWRRLSGVPDPLDVTG